MYEEPLQELKAQATSIGEEGNHRLAMSGSFIMLWFRMNKVKIEDLKLWQ